MSNETDGGYLTPDGVILEIEREGKIVRVTWLGEITLSVIREGFSKVREFAKGRDLRGAISDFTHARNLNLSKDDIYVLSHEEPVFETDFPRITVGGADHIFGMARMFELMTAERTTGIHVVRTIDEAYALLQLQDPEFNRVETV
ncbi:MAG TPA: hypothetical protein VMU24_02730 [Candidatus Acidoferrales bacterium]|jgi:hypothetical protein|nr:hypothetical protein [Candidatus Acidoferrales bacterium]